MTDRFTRSPRGEVGFTLVELLVSMVILGIFMTMFAVAMSSTIHHSSVVQEQSTLQVEARAAADVLVRDLRQAASGVDGVCPISSATSTSLQFLSPDGAQPSHQRTIAVRLTGGSFQRAMSRSTNTAPPWTGMWTTPPADAWRTQVGSITNTAVFSYFTSAGAPISTPVAAGSLGSIKMIGMTLTTSAKASNGQKTKYDTRTTLRVTSC